MTRSARNYPEEPAVIFNDRVVNYTEYACRVGKLTAGLKKLGISPGDFVALILPNHIEFNISYFAIVTAGAVVVPVNPLYKGPEVSHILGDCKAVAVITVPPFAPLVKSLLPELPSLRHIIVMGGGEQEPGMVNYQDLFDNPVDLSRPPVNEYDLAACMYTSGTTGRPKGAMLTHKNLVFDSHAVTSYIGIEHTERFMGVLPFFHAFAATVCILATACTGSSVVILERFLPQQAVKAIDDHRVTVFPAVPSMYAAILAATKDLPPGALSSLRMFVSGGAAMPLELMRMLEKRFGVVVIEGNGPTEASPISYVNPLHGRRKPGSVGPPLPGVEVRIVDENDHEVPRGTIGEILIRGDNVMKGYLNQPVATEEALRGGWLHTGDMGTMDGDGYVFIVDRKKDMIIVGGFNVYPREVEEVLCTHPKVMEAAVIGVPDELRGEVPRAVIVLMPGETATAREIIKYCQERLANFKCPRQVQFIESLPKMANGKVLKRALKEGLV